MKVAILGYGTIGGGVYDIIKNNQNLTDIAVMKILEKDLTKATGELKDIITNDYNEILKNKDIEVIIEVMGAGDFSYKCIKEALEAKKHVITANKEVLALHFEELFTLKEKHNVALLFEASVGGGVYIINPLFEIAKFNEIRNIIGILNGTTNYILTKMTNENMSFSAALKDAQVKGFAEADSDADIEGLDMVRKIAILSMIGYKKYIDINKIYHYGMKNISEEDISFLNKNGLILKFAATSISQDKSAFIAVEPIAVSKNNMMSICHYENNIISVEANINGNLKFYGKGAGRYPTASVIINDLILIKEARSEKVYIPNGELNIDNTALTANYYIRVNDADLVDKGLVHRQKNNMLITKQISREELYRNMSNIVFYARIF